MKYKIDFITEPDTFNVQELISIRGGGTCIIRIGDSKKRKKKKKKKGDERKLKQYIKDHIWYTGNGGFCFFYY